METNYFWDSVTGTCLAELDENGDVTVQYTANPQTGELISENHAGEEVYHHYDGDGNTRQTTDSAGNVLGEATYTAFGETVAESGDMNTTYRFRGEHGLLTDPTTGEVFMGSGEYSPSLGRMLNHSSSLPETVAGFGAAAAVGVTVGCYACVTFFLSIARSCAAEQPPGQPLDAGRLSRCIWREYRRLGPIQRASMSLACVTCVLGVAEVIWKVVQIVRSQNAPAPAAPPGAQPPPPGAQPPPPGAQPPPPGAQPPPPKCPQRGPNPAPPRCPQQGPKPPRPGGPLKGPGKPQGLDCATHAGFCMCTMLGNRVPGANSSRCFYCWWHCRRNGGVWPGAIAGPVGPMIRCDYWNPMRWGPGRNGGVPPWL